MNKSGREYITKIRTMHRYDGVDDKKRFPFGVPKIVPTLTDKEIKELKKKLGM